MQEIIILLVSLSLLDVWIYELVIPICLKEYDKMGFKLMFKYLFNYKPFNCERCLSFWVGLILSIYFGNVIFLVLPLIVKLKNKL